MESTASAPPVKENELNGLLNWSLPFARAAGCLCLAAGVVKLASTRPGSFWLLAQGVCYLLAALPLFRFFSAASKYVETEEELHLGQAMAQLGSFWCHYRMLLTVTLATVLVVLAARFSPLLAAAEGSPLFWVGASTAILVYTRWVSKSEGRRPFAGATFLRQIPAFAKLSLSRTQGTAFFSLGVGTLLCVFSLTDLFKGTGLTTGGLLLTGLGALLLGTALAFYWRSVREIHRNPALVYYERTLERLNFYWLIACCLGFPLLLVGSFF